VLTSETTLLIVIDVQGNLARVVAESESAIRAVTQLVQGANLLEIPVLLTAQVPEKIGHTIPEIAGLLPDQTELPRVHFSIWQDAAVQQAIRTSGRCQLLLCGFEAHICLYQSSLDLISDGFEVYLVADAVSSRNPYNKTIALQELAKQGVHLTTVEMALFSLLRSAQHPAFKPISKIIK
jgi:isochorismate hydrolase